ncbi:hypothetical protein B0H14DRAFT_1217220 [Mycena olivaceomarginata]|nr:hypothetical protein B0H14DRAFT_1217220 [Mycena olivaceomarginata]
MSSSSPPSSPLPCGHHPLCLSISTFFSASLRPPPPPSLQCTFFSASLRPPPPLSLHLHLLLCFLAATTPTPLYIYPTLCMYISVTVHALASISYQLETSHVALILLVIWIQLCAGKPPPLHISLSPSTSL